MKTVWLTLLAGLCWTAQAASMTEILYEDSEPGEPPYLSRILIAGDRVRLDYGRDADDFSLYDRRAGKLYVVGHGSERITVIAAGQGKVALPKGWRLNVAESGERTRQLWLNGRMCAEVRSAPLLPDEARLLADLRRTLAASQAAAWRATPAELRDPCALVLDGARAGFEYELGLPLTIRYGDGRSRAYRSHGQREAQAELFELPAQYRRFNLK